ncbi:MAG TPA: conjugal transfer protein TraF [Thermoanaerobaculia bacterium]|nr:conjugal transfer protein TraF [Thermoanaerobaculia bacterium]
MRPHRSLPLVAVFAALLGSSALLAQQPFVGSRSAGMAGASVAVAEDATALWINPAGLSRSERPDLDVFAGAVATDRGRFLSTADGLSRLDPRGLAGDPAGLAAAVADLRRMAAPGTGVVGSGAGGLVFVWKGLALGIGDLAYAGVYPNVDLTHILPGADPASGIRFNTTALREAGLEAREVRLGLSRALFQGVLLLGVTARYVAGRATYTNVGVFAADVSSPLAILRRALRENVERTNRFAVDAGALVNILGKVRVGIVSTALNAPTFSVKRDPGNPELLGAPDALRLPRTLRAGAEFAPIGPLTVAVDGDLIRTETLVPGARSQQLSGGLELRLPLFAVRVGAFRDFAAIDPHWAVSAGFGIGLPVVSVDAAFVASTHGGPSLSASNQRDIGASFSTRFRF